MILRLADGISIEWGAAVGDISREHDWITPLLLQYEGPLLRYAQRLMNCPDRARDVVQETFLRLCREPAVAREAHVAQWLFTVCRNYAIDLKRKEQRMTPAASAELGNSPSPAPTPDAQAEHKRDRRPDFGPGPKPAGEPANGADAQVPRALSYKEIAGVTGLSVSNVGYLIHQGLTTLRQHFKNDL